MGMPEVFEVTKVPLLRYSSILSNTFLLIDKFSTTASIIQSQFFMRLISSSKLPVLIREEKEGWNKGSGLVLIIFCKLLLTILLRTLPAASVNFLCASSSVRLGGGAGGMV